jgi:hypothetical protein
MLLARIEELDRHAISYDEDLKTAYAQAIQDVLSGKISYHEFLDTTEVLEDTFRQRAMKTIDMKFQDSGFGF